MPPKGKTKTQSIKSPSSSKNKHSLPLNPPKPFTRPTSKLNDFLPKLSKQHVYITHIDSKSRDFKRKIFLVPVAMNVLLIAGMIWRIKQIGPFYIQILFSLMGRINETTIHIATTPNNDILREIFRRGMTFMFDFLIYVFIWPWPRDFFAGTKISNPIAWRFGVGFRDKEIIVRRSRKWDLAVGNVLDEESSGAQLLMENIRRAVDPVYMNEKTGYLMLNREWDLDWSMMVQATTLIDTKKLTLEDFRTTILVYHPEYEWMVIESERAGGSAKEEEGRRKIIAFKDELTALGKENLFFKWIELVQYESSRPGGFGPERQRETMGKAKELFESQGVDFDKFWVKVGGIQGMPGMDDY
jgi:hypothetical protein